MMGSILPALARILDRMRFAVAATIFFAFVGMTVMTMSVQAEGAQATVEDYLGSWKGRWHSNGRSGSAKWNIETQENGSIHLSAVIYTPGGRVEYTFEPQFNAETGVLEVRDAPSGTTGTIMVDGDNVRFDYRRKGRNGYYNLKKE